MPRARKTASGAPAQPVQTATGQPYGAAQAQQEAQMAAPLPAIDLATLNQAAMAEVQSGVGEGILPAPDAHPRTPVQEGLAYGPGAGPEAISAVAPREPMLDVLRVAAAAGGNPRIQRLIQIAESRRPVVPATPPLYEPEP